MVMATGRLAARFVNHPLDSNLKAEWRLMTTFERIVVVLTVIGLLLGRLNGNEHDERR